MRRMIMTAAVVTAGLTGSVLSAAAAHADLGDILVAQTTADGRVVCTQDYFVANGHGAKTITDPVCAEAVSARILNESSMPVTVHDGAAKTVSRFVGQTIAVQTPENLTFDIPAGW
jgi:hypothetical protein